MTSTTYSVPLSPASLTHYRPTRLTRAANTSSTPATSTPPTVSSLNATPATFTINSSPPAKLKIKTLPHVNVASPPFPLGAWGRKVEHVADIAVPVGGKVVLNLLVDVDGLLQLEGHGGRRSGWDDGDGGDEDGGSRRSELENRVKETVERILALVSPPRPAADPGSRATRIASIDSWTDAQNKEQLGINHIASTSPSSFESSTESSLGCITLSPIIADITGTTALEVLLVTGKPTAALTSIDISLSWEPSETSPVVESDSEDADGKGEKPVLPDGNGDDDMLLLDDLLDATTLESQASPASRRQEKSHMGDRYEWVSQQLEGAMHRVIRIHMIRRFPLVFDGALIQQSRTFHPHRTLTQSLNRFLSLAQTHNRPSFLSASHNLFSIGAHQEAHVLLHARAASNVPHRKGKGKTRKKRRTGTAAESQSQASEESQRCGLGRGVELDPAEERVQAHLGQVALKIQEEEGSGQGVEMRVLGRLVREGMGAVGRARWEMDRNGMGRLAAHRVKLHSLDEITGTRTPSAHQPKTAWDEDDELLCDFAYDIKDTGDRRSGDTPMEMGEGDDMQILGWEDDEWIRETRPDAGKAFEPLPLDADFDLNMNNDLDLDLDLDMDLDPGLDLDLDIDLEDSQEQSHDSQDTETLHHRTSEVNNTDKSQTDDPYLLDADDLLADRLFHSLWHDDESDMHGTVRTEAEEEQHVSRGGELMSESVQPTQFAEEVSAPQGREEEQEGQEDTDSAFDLDDDGALMELYQDGLVDVHGSTGMYGERGGQTEV